MDRVTAAAREHPYVVAVFVVVIIVIIWIFVLGDGASASIEEHMTGCWIAPEDFCESADIDSMLMVFGPPPARSWLGSRTRTGYIVILPNGIASLMTLTYEGVRSTGPHSCEISARIEFEDGPDWGSDPCKISIDMCRGAMQIIRDRDGSPIVAARLYRNNDISDLVTGIVGDDAQTDSAPIT